MSRDTIGTVFRLGMGEGEAGQYLDVIQCKIFSRVPDVLVVILFLILGEGQFLIMILLGVGR